MHLSRFNVYYPPKSGRGPVYLTILGTASFIDNIAGCGGAIYASGALEYRSGDYAVSTVAHLDVGDSVVFSGNSGVVGGAIYIEGRGTLTIRGNARFQGNSGLAQAGAVHAVQSTANITGQAVFDSNYAPWGGALSADKSVIRLSGAVRLSGNSAQNAGGAIVAVASSVISILDDVTVVRSSAMIGGALGLDSSTLIVAGRAWLGNNHAGIGGMASVKEATVTIADSARIENNQAESDGGGVFMSGSSLDIRGSVMFVGNRAGGSGGCIAARASGSVLVTGAPVHIENTAGSFGGAIDADSSVTLSLDGNVSLMLNRAANGGGLSLRQAARTRMSYFVDSHNKTLIVFRPVSGQCRESVPNVLTCTAMENIGDD